MSSNTKDTIYIDIDDEITSIIEKVQSSPHKIVALVLPKRATMLQSIVNMKLLKRTADDGKKNLVLITSEAGLLPLAGAVGLHVAKTLQSKPEIPPQPSTGEDAAEAIEDAGDVDIDPEKPIGELAGLPATDKESEETIEVDDMEEEAPVTAQTKPKAKKKDRKLKVPNFNKFRTRLFLGIGGFILLIILWYLASYVMPSATITVQTDTSNVNSEVTFTARTGLEELDIEKSLVPARTKELEKSETEKVPATGQKDVGKKASGDVTMYIECNDVNGSPPTIPAGTGVTTGNLTFITQNAASLTTPDFSDGCHFKGSSKVTAQNGGEQYNIGPADYSVSGYSNVTGTGGSMSGGTSKIIKVVRQEDINSARDKLVDKIDDAAKEELVQQLGNENFLAIAETFKSGKPSLSSSPNVGDEATEVTVTSQMKFTMTGIEQAALEKLIEDDVKDDVDITKQAISDYGLSDAVFRVLSNESNGDVRLSVTALVVAGPQLNADELKKEVRGKSKSETTDIIKNRPGIRDVDIDYSPFWVFSTPRKEGKINIIFESLEETNNTDADNQGQ